jgi:PAS domain S-box-containing protein
MQKNLKKSNPARTGVAGTLGFPKEKKRKIYSASATHPSLNPRKEEELLNGFYKAIPQPLVVFEPNSFTIVYGNPAFLNLYGFTRTDLLELTIFSLHKSCEDISKLKRLYRKLQKNGSTAIACHFDKKGTCVQVELRGAELELCGRNYPLVFIHDITDTAKKQEEQKLIAEIEKLAAGSKTFKESVEKVLHKLRVFTGCELAELWVFSQENQYAFIEAFSSVKNEASIRKFVSESLKLRITQERIASSELYASFKPVWISEIEERPRLFRHQQAIDAGFRSVIVLPITEQDKLTGGVFLFAKKRIECDPDKLKLLVRVMQEINAEIKHHRTYEQLQSFFALSRDLMCIGDAQGRFKRINSSFSQVLGFTEQELIGRHFLEFVHEEDLEKTQSAMADIFRQKKLKEFRHRFRCQNGEYKWLSWSVTFSKDHQLLLAAARDITERKKVSEELNRTVAKLQAAEERYATFLENSSEAIWRIEIPGGISTKSSFKKILDYTLQHGFLAECNKTFAGMYGYEEPDDMVGFPLKQMMPVEDPSNVEYFRTFVKSGFNLCNAESVEHDIKGNKKYILNNLIGIVENGKLIRIWGTQRDITTLKVAEKEILRREEQYRTLSENVPVMIYRVDRALRLTYVNKTVKQLFSLDSDSILGKTPRELGLDEPTWNNLKAKGEELFRTGNPDSFMFSLPSRRVPGKSYHLLVNLTPERNEAGEVTSLIAIANEITPIIKAQEELIYKDKLLSVIAEAANTLLKSEDFRVHLDDILKSLGTTTASDRAYIFENSRNGHDFLVSSQTYEWCADGCTPQINSPDFQEMPFNFFADQMEGLTEGIAYSKIVSEIQNKPLRDVLQAAEVQSLLVVPIFVDEEFWGFVGFDDCRLPRVWNDIDKGILKTFASSLASAIKRKRAEDAILESEARFKHMADNAPVMIWVSDENDNTVYVNKSWIHFTGIEAKTFNKTGWSALVHPDDVKIAINDYDLRFRNREPVQLEYRLKSADGEYRWVIDYAIPRFLPNGNFLGYIGSVIDIHDRKLSEEKISYQAHVLQEVSEAIVSTDLNQVVTTWNKGAEKIHGVKASEIVGKRFREVINHVYISQPREQALHQLHQNGLWSGEVYYDRADGRRVYLQSSITFITNQKGERIGLVGVHHDITEKKNAEIVLKRNEQQLREYSERINGILDSITDGFIAVDKEMRVFLWNKVFEQNTSINASEAFGKKITEVFPQLSNRLYDQLEKALRQNTTIVYDSYSKSRSMWFETTAFPSAQGLFIYFRDITNRKRQEALLALEKEVLELNARPQVSLKATSDFLLKGIEQMFPGIYCSVLRLKEDGKTIETISAPSLPPEFRDSVNGLSIGPRMGSCGTAMYLKRNIIVEDIENSELWEQFRELPLKHGLRACWSFPILSSQHKALASFAIYHSHVKGPSAEEMQVIARMINLLRVIIENKESEEKIKISNERYLLATMATNDAIWDWDVSRDNMYWGEGFHSLFGYRAGTYRNDVSMWEDNIHPEDRERVLKSIRNFIESSSQQVWQDEYRFRKADGQYVLVSDRGFLIYNQEGKVSRMVGSIQDITEKREMEKALLKQEIDKQKLVAQAVVDAQEKERSLIGKELHDNINQILSTAKLYLEVARNDEQERDALISMSVNSISDAINEIRTISRSLVPASIGDLGLVESIQDLVESIKITRKLNVEFNYDERVDELMTEQQKLMLFRITQEQVNNVIKHAQAQNLVIALMAEDETISITLTDDGKGFDPDQVKFKKGVGLSNISSRAELFNGKVNIQSAPGKGCTLNIVVPISNL